MPKKPDTKLKVHFRIAIKTVSNLTSGKDVILMWRRGSRKRAGALHEVKVQGNEATWNQEFSVSCKYHDDVDRASLPTKQLTLLVKEVTGTKRKPRKHSEGKVKINLSDFVKDTKCKELTLAAGTKRSSPIFRVAVQAELMKIGNRRLVPVTSGGSYHRGGQSYRLETEDNMSETSVDSSSEAESDDEVEEENGEDMLSVGDVDYDLSGGSAHGSEGEADESEDATDVSTSEQTSKTVKLQQELIKSLKDEIAKQKADTKLKLQQAEGQRKQLVKEIQRLTEEKEKKEKEDYRLQKELMTVKSQINAITRGSSTKTTIATLTERVIRAEDENNSLKKKLSAHTTEIANLKRDAEERSKQAEQQGNGSNQTPRMSQASSLPPSAEKSMVAIPASQNPLAANNVRVWQASTLLLLCIVLKLLLF